MALQGNDLLILNSSGTALIAGAKSCEIDVNCETIETSSPSNGAARTYIAGRTDWTVSVGYLVTTPLSDLPNVGTSVSIRIKVRNGSYLSGSAIFQTCRITATRGNLCQGTFQLRGTGPLSYHHSPV